LAGPLVESIQPVDPPGSGTYLVEWWEPSTASEAHISFGE